MSICLNGTINITVTSPLCVLSQTSQPLLLSLMLSKPGGDSLKRKQTTFSSLTGTENSFCILTKWYLLTEMLIEIRGDEVTRHNVIGISVDGKHQSREMKHVLCLDRTSVGREEVLHPGGLAVAVEAYVML